MRRIIMTTVRRERQLQLRRHRLLVGGLILVAALGVLSTSCADRQIVLNTSPSVAPGLYVRSVAEPGIGRLVDFRIPPAALPYVRARTGRDARDWYVIKPVAAGPGDHVDTTGACLEINGRRVAPMPPAADATGRPLPAWRARRTLGPGEFFVFSDRIPNSFDSRCYGPVRREQIAAVRRPLVTW